MCVCFKKQTNAQTINESPERERGEERGPTPSQREGSLTAQGPETAFPVLISVHWTVCPLPGAGAVDPGSVGWGFVRGCTFFGSAFSVWQFQHLAGEQKTWVLILVLPG